MTQSAFAPLRALIARVLQPVLRQAEQARMRRDLQRLDPHLLRDIGLSRSEAEALAESLGTPPIWDVPPHWRVRQSRPKDCANPAGDA